MAPRASPKKRAARTASSAPTKRSARSKPARAKRSPTPDDAELESSDDNHEDEDAGDEFREELDSDALDEDDVDDDAGTKKRKRTSPTKGKVKSARAPKRSAKRRRDASDEDEDEDADAAGVTLAPGQVIVGTVVQAPKSGRVPPGRISQNTLNFLAQLKDPECNDRECCNLTHIHIFPPGLNYTVCLTQPVFRLAEKEWKAFIEKLTDLIVEVDTQIPTLPPKDVIYRIYRDVRFSNDKTPYKTGFTATFSRSGRKGIFAGSVPMRCCFFMCSVEPGGGSLLAAGSWAPGKNELATIRSHLQHNASRLRQVISAEAFVARFGEPAPHPKGARRSIFGMEDELKVSPKGIDKTHKNIDLLKCRSFVVVHKFTDEQVLRADFGQKLAEVFEVAKPLVYCLNDYMTVGIEDEEAEGEGEGEEEEEGEGGTEGE
ncbi:hypothetical protein HETIRDRAFT_327131 [Heterobasidion irregulare TC 32-1]|uniref:Uncharacterized protein n=1 Tax=Heterobasidion irregulare (strain TC 32-1) TaxID=747525 RepID=W4JWN5_HETIT|nr:uncharacterized protein HETIRDRAFT_327131 [Heterobasidion irregulare TC 32-1]ETW77505.1 hypothetical protein HETIRDRAFT_327131 [Heterobasidion irregulare TC 32-1]